MYHSLIFIDGERSYDTWNNWHLIPSSRPVISRPSVNFKYVDIPGMDGSLDLTNYLVGRPTYSDCSGSFEFIVDNDHGDWPSRKAQLSSILNGREMKLYLTDDPQYYYVGRFTFRNWSSGANYSTVSIEYRVKPYKYLASSGKKVWA